MSRTVLPFVEIMVEVPKSWIGFFQITPYIQLLFIVHHQILLLIMTSYLNVLPELCLGKDVVLVGTLTCQGLSPTHLTFHNCFNFLDLTQWVHESTYYSSSEDRVIDVQVLPSFLNFGYSSVTCSYIIQHWWYIPTSILGLWTNAITIW